MLKSFWTIFFSLALPFYHGQWSVEIGTKRPFLRPCVLSTFFCAYRARYWPVKALRQINWGGHWEKLQPHVSDPTGSFGAP